MKEKVGLIGFGIMGEAIARCLIKNNYSVVVFDPLPIASQNAELLGCAIAKAPSEVSEQTRTVIMSLPKPEHVKEVVRNHNTGLLIGASKGSTIVDTSTVDPATSQENSEICYAKGVGYLDCPVLGRPSGYGNWTLPTGGRQNDIERVRPILSTFASNIVSVGECGRGSLVKLLNNLMFGAINSITCEVFALCRKADMDESLFFETIANSGAGTVSNLFKELGPKIISGDFSPVFSIDNLHKDVDLGLSLAKKLEIELEVSEAGQKLNLAARKASLGKKDTAAVVEMYEK
tara:strand:- start:863 stop:1732 length:870 start_codon:yes stop_codon:yes gene_type:complete